MGWAIVAVVTIVLSCNVLLFFFAIAVLMILLLPSTQLDTWGDLAPIYPSVLMSHRFKYRR